MDCGATSNVLGIFLNKEVDLGQCVFPDRIQIIDYQTMQFAMQTEKIPSVHKEECRPSFNPSTAKHGGCGKPAPKAVYLENKQNKLCEQRNTPQAEITVAGSRQDRADMVCPSP